VKRAAIAGAATEVDEEATLGVMLIIDWPGSAYFTILAAWKKGV